MASRNDGTGLDCITYDMRFPMLYSHVIIYIPTGPLTVIVIIRSHLCYFCQSSYNFSIIHDFKSVTMLGIVPFLFIGNTQCIIVFKCNFFSIFFILFEGVHNLGRGTGSNIYFNIDQSHLPFKKILFELIIPQ